MGRINSGNNNVKASLCQRSVRMMLLLRNQSFLTYKSLNVR
jgi:hypothetical protein